MGSLINQETLNALKQFDAPGQRDFLTKIIQVYLSDTAMRFPTLWMAQRGGNADELSKAAHAIKGSSLNVGAEQLAALMQTIEKEGRSGVVSAAEKLTEAEALYQKVSVELKTILI